MNDQGVLNEVLKLVDEGLSVTLPVKGTSMLPFIIGGKESVILQKPDKPKIGEVVLAWIDERRYVIHRIIGISDGRVTLMGDGNLRGVEYCSVCDIKGVVTHIVDGEGSKTYLYGRGRRLSAKLWYILRPLRKYLLAIFRRI